MLWANRYRNMDVSPGDAFALRTTSDREGHPGSVLSGTVAEWDDPGEFEPADDDTWIARFDPENSLDGRQRPRRTG